MNTGVFSVATVFVPQEVVLAVQLFDSGIDGFERGDVCLHFFLPDFDEVFFLKMHSSSSRRLMYSESSSSKLPASPSWTLLMMSLL